MRGPGDESRVRAARVKKKVAREPAPPAAWTGWRGPARDGRVAWLPETLPARPRIIWEHKLSARGLGGVAATDEYVFVADRELNDTIDTFKCLSAKDGSERWAIRFPCKGDLDFGTSSRATPLIYNDLVFFYGAFGHLHCAEMATGKVLWQMDVRDEFGADDARKWGMCSSPLIVADRLIVNPGARNASLVALAPRTGKVLWKTPGGAASYGSLLAGSFGGRTQIVGHDLKTIGGWDAATGKRLWSVTPPRPNDFNVPTPLRFGTSLVITTENNGTRLYRFGKDGVMEATPAAHNSELAPDSHTPVIVGNRLFGVWNRLYCLDLNNGLRPIWSGEDDAFGSYCAVVASAERLLVITLEGELLLVDGRADRYKLLGRARVLTDEQGVYSHPAFVGTRAYLRGNSSLVCVALGPD